MLSLLDPPTPALVENVRNLYQNRVPNVRLLIPVLNGLTKKEVLTVLPKIIKLNPEILKLVFQKLFVPQVVFFLEQSISMASFSNTTGRRPSLSKSTITNWVANSTAQYWLFKMWTNIYCQSHFLVLLGEICLHSRSPRGSNTAAFGAKPATHFAHEDCAAGFVSLLETFALRYEHHAKANR